MTTVTTLVLLISTVSNIAAFDLNNALERFDLRSRDARMTGGTAITKVADVPPWLLLILDEASTYVGTGIILNKYWLITTAAAATPFKDSTDLAKKLRIYSKVMKHDASGLVTTDVKVRRGKEVKVHTPDASNTLLHAVAIIRFCPSLDATPPTFSGGPPPETAVNMFAYKNKELTMASKKVGEICECDEITGFDKNAVVADRTHVCIKEDLTATPVKGESPDDLKGLVVVIPSTAGANGKETVVGLLVKEQNNSGEIVVDLDKYKNWFSPLIEIKP